MTLDDIKTKIAADAPVLAALLGGAMGTTALETLGRSVVDDADATIDQIGAALDGSPDSVAKVQSAETETVNTLAQAAPAGDAVEAVTKRLDAIVALEQIANADIRDARQHQLQARDWWINPTLAIIVTLGFFSVICFTLLRGEGQQNALAQTLLGVLGTAWVSIIGFYFGSSSGSREKTAILAANAARPAGPAPAKPAATPPS